MVTKYYKFKNKKGEGVIGAHYNRKPAVKGTVTRITTKQADTMLKGAPKYLKKAQPQASASRKTGARYTKLYKKKKR
tara:strand:- start:786 stop:1016 length:231 start_codon:yes stop_codon:yes gene_type:complete